jgi:hypothetical protein
MEVSIRLSQQWRFINQAIERHIRAIQANKTAVAIFGIEIHTGRVFEQIHHGAEVRVAGKKLFLKSTALGVLLHL